MWIITAKARGGLQAMTDNAVGRKEKADMEQQEKRYRQIGWLCIAAAVLTVLPLLVMGHYNYPSADDWSFGASTSRCFREGGSFADIVREAVRVVLLWRTKGEPRYANAFLGALQPGIYGEHFYRVVPWLMIGSLFASELFLGSFLLKSKESRAALLPILIPSLLLQILCVPYPVETFYWYTGAVNYTFIFSLSVVLLTLFLMLAKGGMGKAATAVCILAGVIVAVFVGGDSYAASLSSVCLFFSLSALLLWKDRRALLRTLPITVVTTVGMAGCLIAPGNQARLATEGGGSTTGAGYAVWMSLVRTATNIWSWTSLKIVCYLLLAAPFLWMATGHMELRFRRPLLFTLFTFGIYASQITATMYVDGSTGGRRMADVLYYAYHLWLLLNAGYWIGWLRRQRFMQGREKLEKWKGRIRKGLLQWFLLCGVLLAGVLCATELKTLSTYRACVWLVKGSAADYAKAWEERLTVLKDETVTNVVFAPLPGYEDLVYYADFQQDDTNWVNRACAEYYGKTSVRLE